jgi:hypothetical protein
MTRTNIKFATLLEDEQDEALPNIQQTATNLAAADEQLHECEQELADAKLFLAEINASFDRLDDTYTAADHAEAVSAIERTERRHRGAQKAREAAQKTVRSADLTVAQVVCDVARKALPDVAVYASTVTPSQPPKPSELPCVVVVQHEDPTHHGDGTFTGKAEVIYYRSDLHRELNIRAFEDAADHLCVPLEALDAVVKTSSHGDALRVKLRGAHSGAPYIPVIDWARRNALGSRVAVDLASRLRYNGQSVKFDQGSGAYITSHIAALPNNAVVVSEDIDNKTGERKLVVDTSVLVRIAQHPQGRTVNDVIEQVIADLNRGQFITGLGTITEIERVNESDLSLDPDKAASQMSVVNPDQLPTDVSMMGFDWPNQVIVRATLLSRSGLEGLARVA